MAVQELYGFASAHQAAPVGGAPGGLVGREQREEAEHATLAAGATRAVGGGNRARPEEPDAWRTCFERDLDRIQHSRAFRRLAGKCQVFIAPEDDHLRTRLTHAIEVAQDAVRAGIGTPADLPDEVAGTVGTRRSGQLNAFITAVLETIARTGRVGMRTEEAQALAAFRAFNFERIYLRAEAVAQADRVVEL